MSNETEQQPQKRSLLRTALLWLSLLALLFFASTVVLVFAVDLGWQRARLVSFATQIASETLGMEISIGEISGRISEGIEMREGRIGDYQSPFLAFETLELDWNLQSLFSSERQVIDAVELGGWVLHLQRYRDGHWRDIESLIEALATADSADPTSSDTATPLSIRRIDLLPGEVRIDIERENESEPPITAAFAVAGVGQNLRLDPDQAPWIGKASLKANLLEAKSGRPKFDRELRLALEIEASGRHVDALVAELTGPGVSAALHSAGGLDAIDRAEASVDIEELTLLAPWLPTTLPLSGKLEGQAQASGPLDALIGQLQLQGARLQIDSVVADALTLDLDLTDPITNETFSDLASMRAKLEVDAKRIDLGRHRPQWLPRGKSNLSLSGRVDQGKLSIAQGRLESNGLDLSLRGSLTAEQIESLDLEFRVADVDPWVRASRPEMRLSGAVVGSAKLRGAVRNPQGRIELRSKGLRMNDRKALAVDATMERARKGPAQIAATVFLDEISLLTLASTLDLDRERVDFDLKGDAGQLLALFNAEGEHEAAGLESKATASGFARQTPQGVIFDLTLGSDDTRWAKTSLGRVDFVARSPDGRNIEVERLESKGGIANLALAAPARITIDRKDVWNLEPARLALDLTGGSDRPGGVEIRAKGKGTSVSSFGVTLNELPLALVNRLVEDQPSLGGRLSGEADWRRRRVPDWMKGRLEWNEPSIGSARLDRVQATWTADPERIRAALQSSVGGRKPISATAELRLPAPDASLAEIVALERLDLGAEVDELDLSFLESLAPSWIRRVSGKLTGSFRVQPGESEPRMSGALSIAGGSLTVPILRTRFAPIEGGLRFENRVVTIDGLRVGEAGAQAVITGKLEPRPGLSPELDGEIRFEKFPLARSSAVAMDVDGGVDLSGSLERPVLRGTLNLANTRIGVPSADDPILKEIRLATRSGDQMLTEKADTEVDPFENVDAEISFTVPESTRLRGQGANLYVGGQARLEKKPGDKMRVTGEARVVNGTYVFQGRNFRVRRGRVTLTGDTRLDPVLDVEARHPVSDIVAIIELSGRLSSPTVRLTSDPPRSDQDVLAYLLFGRPASSVTVAGDSSFGAAAARLVAGVAERELREVLGDAMPVDSIEIGADSAGNTSELGFGKYLSPNLFFRYVHVLGDEPTDRVGVEYRINDTLSVGSSVSTAGDAGLDLILRSDF